MTNSEKLAKHLLDLIQQQRMEQVNDMLTIVEDCRNTLLLALEVGNFPSEDVVDVKKALQKVIVRLNWVEQNV